jgi:hypothetical protein
MKSPNSIVAFSIEILLTRAQVALVKKYAKKHDYDGIEECLSVEGYGALTNAECESDINAAYLRTIKKHHPPST